MLTGDNAGVIILWNLISWSEVRRYNVPPLFSNAGAVCSVALSPNKIMAAMKFAGVRVWDKETGNLSVSTAFFMHGYSSSFSC
jgi:WD40 repeat protein